MFNDYYRQTVLSCRGSYNALTCVIFSFGTLVTKSSSPTLTHTIPRNTGSSSIVGVTSLNSQLFVLRCSAQEHVEVYDSTTFASLNNISVPGLVNAYGLASCAVNNCLYTSNYGSCSICKIEFSSSNTVVSWNVGTNPTGLSINSSNNLLVTVFKGHKLQEWTTTGALVREINLQQSGITNPWHSVQLAVGELLVTHANRVCHVDDNGALVRSHGKTAGSAIDQLNYPVGLVQARNGCILVADRGNNRIVILNSSLTDARPLSLPVDGGLCQPWALHLDESRGRLYVGEYEGGRLLIFDNVFIV